MTQRLQNKVEKLVWNTFVAHCCFHLSLSLSTNIPLSCNIKNVILLEMYLYSNDNSNSKIAFFHTTMAFGYN